MSNVLEIVWSLPFLLGITAGVLGYHCFAKARCRWRNKHRPRADGKPWRAPGVNRTVWGGLVAAGAVLYVLSQAQQAHDETVALSARTRTCQNALIASIVDNRKISAVNDDLSVRQRDLFSLIDDAGAQWIDRLLNPPADIAALGPQDPRRQQYNIDATRHYFDRVGKYRAEVSKISEQQHVLAEERSKHLLPDPNCGE